MSNIAEKIREFAFWQIDSIKGGHIRSHYRDIRFILENFCNDLSVQLRNKYLEDVLQHARRTTPFYSNVNSNELIDFPVINKNIIRENSESFISADNNFNQAKSVVTSGSTGTPFSVKHDRRKRTRNTADTIYFGELAGFRIGQRLYYFKIWNKFNRKAKYLQFAQNVVPFDVTKLDDNALSLIINTLRNDELNKGLLAYSSVYEAINHFMEKNNSGQIENNTVAIIAMSESFDSVSKQSISHFFNTTAVSRYSNMENGIIAQQLKDGSEEFLINDASYLIEVLDLDSDKPTIKDTPGRIVVTDLFSFCMPMIRYDTGDIGILTKKKINGDLRTVLKSIEGRRMDLIYNTSGSLMSSYVITNNMWKYKEIKQYQFIQNSEKDYLFVLNTDIPFQRIDELINEFQEYLGENANISIEYVHEIPVLASGKRRKVVNNFMKQ
jgi:phenylacetate-CoA ligase